MAHARADCSKGVWTLLAWDGRKQETLGPLIPAQQLPDRALVRAFNGAVSASRTLGPRWRLLCSGPGLLELCSLRLILSLSDGPQV